MNNTSDSDYDLYVMPAPFYANASDKPVI